MKSIKIAALLTSTFLFNSCTSSDKIADVKQQQTAPSKIPEPFRFHKAVEVKPGLTLDVVSWGRGSNSVGAYLILRSDSTNLKYRSISGELDGQIVDVWNMDMDSDGNPELFIQAQGEGEGSHLSMYVYEFSGNGFSQRITFPNLGNASKKGYKGGDSLYIKDDKLMREFSVADADEKSGGATVKDTKKVLEYGLRNNSFTVEEVKTEAEEMNKN